MFRRLFTAPRRTPPDVAEEIAALCNAANLDRLTALPRSLMRDVGLDCGCLHPAHPDVGSFVKGNRMHDTSLLRSAGLLYLAIILLGLGAELLVRAPLAGLDPEAMAAAIRDGALPFRLSILSDAAMVACDVALALVLFLLFRKTDEALAAAAAAFRLIQAAVIAANLSVQHAALLWAEAGEAQMAALAMASHAAGYDLGLIFFGLNGLLTGVLILRSGLVARWIGLAISAAGLVYLAGSGLRVVAPVAAEAFMPAYLIAIVAETAFAVALLRGGLRRQSGRLA